MPGKTIGDERYDVFCEQKSMFDKVTWLEQGPNFFTMETLEPVDIVDKLDRIFNTNRYRRGATVRDSIGHNYFHNFVFTHPVTASGYNSDDLYTDVPTTPPDEDYWSFDLKTEDDRISLSNVVFKGMMNMGGSTMLHSHDVLESVDFKGIGLTLQFYDLNTGGYYYQDLDLPGKLNYKSYVGTFGKLGTEDKTPHLGILQQFTYHICINDPASDKKKIIRVTVELSVVFKSPDNDFEPLGVIEAAKIFPQIRFETQYVDTKTYPEVLDPDYSFIFSEYNITPPASVDPSSAVVYKYRGKVRMVANNNNSAHVDLEQVGTKWYDKNYFEDYRDLFGSPISPQWLEKYFNPAITGNLVGFYTDGNSDNPERMRPWYDTLKIPTWASIFDYKQLVWNETKIRAAYGYTDTDFFDENTRLFLDECQRNEQYVYPAGNPDNAYIDLKKLRRQGEFDNIHLHGYLGNYLDNNAYVIHAPICGYCCFHLHWRWSELNYKLNSNAVAHFLIADGDPNRFKGWKLDDNGESEFLQANQVVGLPLIPPNQSLQVYITRTDGDPDQPDPGNLMTSPTNNTFAALEDDKKAVWYCVELLNLTDVNSSHVILEQGAGFAFRYSKTVGRYIALLKAAAAAYDPALGLLLSMAKTADIFEIGYRLMHFFHNPVFGTSPYADYDQVPDGSFPGTGSSQTPMQKL